MQKLTIKSRLWICTDEGTYLGEGRVTLLEQIDKHGSITKAAKAMNMSYKKAWELVNSMNKQAGSPLVTRTIGGTGGGGSVLSEIGKEAIKLYEEVKKKNHSFLDKEAQELNTK